MNSTIARRRILIFVAFAYGISIALAPLIFFSPRALAQPASAPVGMVCGIYLCGAGQI